MIKDVYYSCGCVISFKEEKRKVTVEKEFTLCQKHGFDMYYGD